MTKVNIDALNAALNTLGLLASETAESKGCMAVFMLKNADGSEIGRLLFDAPGGKYRAKALRADVSPANRKTQTAAIRAYMAAL